MPARLVAWDLATIPQQPLIGRGQKRIVRAGKGDKSVARATIRSAARRLWLRETDPSDASILARISERAAVGLILSSLAASSSALAAAPSPTPDPAPAAPQAVPVGHTHQHTSQPAPTAPQPASPSTSAPSKSRSPAPGSSAPTPAPSGASVGAAPSHIVPGVHLGGGAAAIRAPASSSPRLIHPARTRHRARTRTPPAAPRTLVAPRRDPLRAVPPAAVTPAASRHDGVLLLLGALALAALVGASGMLLRLLARLNAEWYGGSAR
jgi:hypothetical protein